jgi:hypothetical protein
MSLFPAPIMSRVAGESETTHDLDLWFPLLYEYFPHRSKLLAIVYNMCSDITRTKQLLGFAEREGKLGHAGATDKNGIELGESAVGLP